MRLGVEADFRGFHEQFGRHLLARMESATQIRTFIEGGPPGEGVVIVLEEVDRADAEYCLRAVSYELSTQDMPTPTSVVPLPTSRIQAGASVADLINRETLLRFDRREQDAWFREVCDGVNFGHPLPLLEAVAVSVSLALPLRLLKRWIAPEQNASVENPTPETALQRLRRILRKVTEDRRLILSYDIEEADVLLHEGLRRLAHQHSFILVPYSQSRSGSQLPPVLRGEKRVRVSPVPRKEVDDWIDTSFAGTAPSELKETLWSYSVGHPSLLAAGLNSLIESERLCFDEMSGAWTLSLSDHEFLIDYADPFQEALRGMPKGERHVIRDILARAIVCGPRIPIGWILDSMGVDEKQDRSRLIDLVDKRLAEDADRPFLSDLGFTVRDIPPAPGDNSVYSWVDPTLPLALRVSGATEERQLEDVARQLAPVVERRLREARDSRTLRAAIRVQYEVLSMAGLVQEARRAEALLDWHSRSESRTQLRTLITAELEQERGFAGLAMQMARASELLPDAVRLAFCEVLLAGSRGELGLSAENSVDLGHLPFGDLLGFRALRAFLTGRIGEWRQSHQLYGELLPDQERALGPDHRDTLRTRFQMAFGTGEIGDPGEALGLFRELLADQECALGRDDDDTLKTRFQVASRTGELGDNEEALRMFRELLPDIERALGPNDRDTLKSRFKVAYYTGSLGDRAEALRLCRELLPDRERSLGPDHRDTFTTRMQVAFYTLSLGDRAEALRLYREVLLDSERALGPDDPLVASIRQFIIVFS